MKQKFYSILLTALLGMTGMNAWAQDYEITCAQDLADFAAAVNGGEFTANAVLTDDIDMSSLTTWIPIGDWGAQSGTTEACYKGHFDGQGHTITGFNFTASQNYFGIFGVISTGALIENFIIEGAITINGNYGYAGGVAAYARDKTPTIRNVHSAVNINSSSTASTPRIGGILGGVSAQNSKSIIDRCFYSGTLNTNDKGGNYGGIVGYILNNANVSTDITNCLFDGKIQGTVNANSAQYGGIIGYTRKGIVSVENCLSIGTFEYEEGNAMNVGQFIGRLTFDNNTSGCTFANNYYEDMGYNLYGTSSGGAAKGAAPVKVTAKELASGKICYQLNGDQSTINWFQELKNMAFIAEKYVTTVNGTGRAEQSANVKMVENDEGTFDFTLPSFVIHTSSLNIPIGDLCFEGLTIGDDGTFSQEGTFSVPDENIPPLLSAYKQSFQNIHYTLNGKVNGNRFYATLEDISIDMSPMAYTIKVEVGTDDFEAEAPSGDDYPTPYGTAVVYANGDFNCDMTPKEGSEVIYSNTSGSLIAEHIYENGFCTFCGAFDEDYMTANADGVFEIGTPAQLKWFAVYVNKVNPAVDAILTADIDMGGSEWTPIGNSSVAFTGKFDGQGKAITGFSQTATTTHNGLFGNINGATVQNFSISGSLTSDKNYCGVIGLSKGSSKVKGIHSSLNLDIQFKGWAGGVVGGADGYIVIEECSFDGTLNTHNFEDSKGGILGYANTATIKNCLFSGTIVGEGKQHYGGILGYVNNGAFGGVQNCLSIGSVTTTNTSHNGVAAIVGNMNSSTKVDGIFNNYWLTGSSYAGNNGAKAPDAEAPVEVTAEQLASGEVTAKLGIAFRQNIGTDATPVLDPTHNVVAEITAAGYATLYVPDTDVTIPAGVTAYTGEFATNPNNGIQHLAMTEVNGGVLPAQTAVVLKGAEGIYEFAVSVPVPDGALGVYDDEVNGENALVKGWAAPIAGNVLKGTADDIEAAGKYVLAQPAGEPVCFYLAESGIIKAGKAYLEVPAGTEVKAFYFSFGDDDATGLSDMSDMSDHSDIIFNLAGQRIQKMQKGVNIVGGKKILF